MPAMDFSVLTDGIYEKLDQKIDIERLRAQIEQIVRDHPPTMQSPTFGGWSVLTRTGQMEDGWEQGHHRFYEDEVGQIKLDIQKMLEERPRPETTHTQPTPICQGYLAEVMQQITDLGFGPYRARISLLKAGGGTSWHTDSTSDIHRIRLHIPIITNPYCRFETKPEWGAAYFPADGHMYLVPVNRFHRAINYSDKDRIHLIMGVTDTKGVSKWCRAPGFENGENSPTS